MTGNIAEKIRDAATIERMKVALKGGGAGCSIPNVGEEDLRRLIELAEESEALRAERDEWNHNYIMCSDAKVIYRDKPKEN